MTQTFRLAIVQKRDAPKDETVSVRPSIRYTIENNLGATHNVLCAVTESGLDIHLVHLGTMGVYGYASLFI